MSKKMNEKSVKAWLVGPKILDRIDFSFKLTVVLF